MLNFNTILDAVVTAWQNVPEILQSVDGELEAIHYFSVGRPESPSYEDALVKMQWPSILVSHVSVNMGFRGQISQWRHTIRADIKLMGDVIDYPTLLTFLVDGVPTGSNLTLMQCSFLDDVDSMEDVVFSRESDVDGKAFYRMEFALQERGGNG